MNGQVVSGKAINKGQPIKLAKFMNSKCTYGRSILCRYLYFIDTFRECFAPNDLVVEVSHMFLKMRHRSIRLSEGKSWVIQYSGAGVYPT